MKTIIINASPRKSWNTAQMLKAARTGAEGADAEVEYVDLYDLEFVGCHSCLACKRNDAERCKCYWNDDLSPLIDRILKADALIIGSPIYFGEPTSQFRALLERLLFCMLSYNGDGPYFTGKINLGLVFTMNAPQEMFETRMKPMAEGLEKMMGNFLRGETRVIAASNTLQVTDYSKYQMGMFDPEKKQAYHDEQFPKDLAAAEQMGAELSK